MTTIDQLAAVIAKLRDERRTALSLLRKNNIANSKVGAEGEYQLQGLIGGIESLLIDMTALIKAEKTFYILSSALERQQLLGALNNLLANISTFNAHLNLISAKGFAVNSAFQFTNETGAATQIPVNEILNGVEALKPILRTFRTKESPERFQELAEQASTFIRAKQECEGTVEKIYALQKDAEELKKQAEQINGKGEEIVSQLAETLNTAASEAQKISAHNDDAAKKLAAVSIVVTDSAAKAEQLLTLHADAVNQSSIIDQLAKRAETRNNELDKQAAATKIYEEKLAIFEETHQKELKKVSETLEQAQHVLKTAGEVALGSHFKNQYEIARNGQVLWAIISLVLFGVAIWLGYDTVHQSGDDSIAYLRRFTLVPLALLGAYFCSRQYETQNKIAEDYAHKKVLALSITSFRQQLSNPADATQLDGYLNKVLEELHRYPLALQQKAPQEKKNTERAEVADSFKDFLERVKSIKEIISSKD